jgi:CUB domain
MYEPNMNEICVEFFLIALYTAPCGPQVLLVDSTMKELTSPGWSNSLTYAPNLRCRWKLRSKEVIRFDIHVTNLDIESSVGCENDKLIITEDAVTNKPSRILHFFILCASGT